MATGVLMFQKDHRDMEKTNNKKKQSKMKKIYI